MLLSEEEACRVAAELFQRVGVDSRGALRDSRVELVRRSKLRPEGVECMPSSISAAGNRRTVLLVAVTTISAPTIASSAVATASTGRPRLSVISCANVSRFSALRL